MKRVIGVDVSSKNLDCYSSVLEESKRFFNTDNGISKFLNWASAQALDLVVMESTGKLHFNVWYKCEESGIGTVVANPRRVRNLAKGLGVNAKTDDLDSKLLCIYGQKADVKFTKPPTEEERKLKELVSTRLQLVESRVQLINKKSSALKDMKRFFDSPIKHITEEIERLDIIIRKLIEEVPYFKKKKRYIDKRKRSWTSYCCCFTCLFTRVRKC